MKAALKTFGDAIRQPTLNNDNLAYIVNSREGEKLDQRPFDFTFVPKRIMKCNAKVGFALFTRACLKNKMLDTKWDNTKRMKM